MSTSASKAVAKALGGASRAGKAVDAFTVTRIRRGTYAITQPDGQRPVLIEASRIQALREADRQQKAYRKSQRALGSGPRWQVACQLLGDAPEVQVIRAKDPEAAMEIYLTDVIGIVPPALHIAYESTPSERWLCLLPELTLEVSRVEVSRA